MFTDYATTHTKAAKALAKTFDLPLDDAPATAETVPLVRFTLEVDTATE